MNQNVLWFKCTVHASISHKHLNTTPLYLKTLLDNSNTKIDLHTRSHQISEETCPKLRSLLTELLVLLNATLFYSPKTKIIEKYVCSPMWGRCTSAPQRIVTTHLCHWITDSSENYRTHTIYHYCIHKRSMEVGDFRQRKEHWVHEELEHSSPSGRRRWVRETRLGRPAMAMERAARWKEKRWRKCQWSSHSMERFAGHSVAMSLLLWETFAVIE